MKQALIGLLFAAGIAVALTIWFVKTRPHMTVRPVTLTGVTLIADQNPKNQLPIAGATVSATRGSTVVRAISDSTGLWRITMPPPINAPARVPPPQIRLSFQHEGYRPVDLAVYEIDRIFVARLTPIAQLSGPEARESDVVISNVRLRYSEKASFTTDSGSIVNELEVPNRGGYSCDGHPVCSPDGQWRAAQRTFNIDGQGNELRRARLSCIAGPCPFSKVISQVFSNDDKALKITILNWSDTVTYLLEAEVARVVQSDIVRQSYPAIFGDTMTFTLPKTAEGPSVEAELKKQDIVFPLGPDIRLSWASCTEKPSQNDSKLFRCDLKSGYRFSK